MFSASDAQIDRANELHAPPPRGQPYSVPLPGSEGVGRSTIYRHWRFTDKPLLSRLVPEVCDMRLYSRMPGASFFLGGARLTRHGRLPHYTRPSRTRLQNGASPGVSDTGPTTLPPRPSVSLFGKTTRQSRFGERTLAPAWYICTSRLVSLSPSTALGSGVRTGRNGRLLIWRPCPRVSLPYPSTIPLARTQLNSSSTTLGWRVW